MNKVVGKVTQDECKEIQFLFERRNGLNELVKILDPHNDELYEKVVTDLGETTTRFQNWWDRMIAKFTGANVIRVGIGGGQLRQRTTPVDNPTNDYAAYAALDIYVSIRLRTTCIIDSKLKATCSSWPKLGQVDFTWFVLPTCLAGVHGELHGCSRSRVSGAGYPPSIHVD